MLERPKTRDLYGDAFKDACHALADQAKIFEPDYVVGIETGGAVVAKEMMNKLPNAKYISVKLQRPATRVKTRLLSRQWLARLPSWLSYTLRWLEVEVREFGLKPHEQPHRNLVVKGLAGRELSTLSGGNRILIVDDTVDSGRSLTTIREATQSVAPHALIQTAVLASTWRNPPLEPDIVMFDRTMLRMPWSLDARQPQA